MNNKKVALFMIMNIIMAFFTVINIQEVNAESRCCVIEESCSPMDTSVCSSQGGQVLDTPTCTGVLQCNTGCCVSNSACEAGRTKTWCDSQEGRFYSNSADCSAITSCEVGSCILNNECFSGVSKNYCESQGSAAVFLFGVQDEASCSALLRGEQGCCTLPSGQTARTTSVECTGSWDSGLCSSVSDCSPRDHKECVNGHAYWVDSCGNVENVYNNEREGSDDNRGILTLAESTDFVGFCDPSQGEVCKEISGDAQCVDVNCDVGDVFVIETNLDENYARFLDKNNVKITAPDGKGKGSLLGETFYQQKGNRLFNYYEEGITSRKEETKESRLNGESWCMLWPQPDWDESRKEANPADPGSRDYVFKCENGEIKIMESCAAYRSEICEENYDSEKGITSADCVDNKWESCARSDQDDCSSKGNCRWTGDYCVPIIPPGNVFWDNDRLSEGETTMCYVCGSGDGGCEDASCKRLGDCKSRRTTSGWVTWTAIVVATVAVAFFTAGALSGVGLTWFGTVGTAATATTQATAATGVFALGGSGFVGALGWTASGIAYAGYATTAFPIWLAKTVWDGITPNNPNEQNGGTNSLYSPGSPEDEKFDFAAPVSRTSGTGSRTVDPNVARPIRSSIQTTGDTLNVVQGISSLIVGDSGSSLTEENANKMYYVKSIAGFYDTPVDYTEGGDIVYNGMMALSVDLLTPDMPFYILDRGNDFTKIKYSLSGSNFERVGWIETKLIK